MLTLIFFTHKPIRKISSDRVRWGLKNFNLKKTPCIYSNTFNKFSTLFLFYTLDMSPLTDRDLLLQERVLAAVLRGRVAARVRHRVVPAHGRGPPVVVARVVAVGAAALHVLLELVPLGRDGRVLAVLRQLARRVRAVVGLGDGVAQLQGREDGDLDEGRGGEGRGRATCTEQSG